MKGETSREIQAMFLKIFIIISAIIAETFHSNAWRGFFRNYSSIITGGGVEMWKP